MKKNKAAGYTIVELLIVVAVTATMATTAFTMIQGQQARNQFAQAVRDFETKMTDIANDTAKGYFPNIGGNVHCTAPRGADLSFTAGIDQQGSSADCVFAGKVIEFNPDDDDTKMRVHTIAARRMDRNGKTVTSLSQLGSDDVAAAPNIEETFTLLYGLRIKSVKLDGSEASSMGFMSGFASRSQTGTFLTGAPETSPYWINNTSFAQSTADLVDVLTEPDNYVLPASGSEGIVICTEFGEGGRQASFTFGQDGRQLAVTTEIDITC